MMMVLIIGLHVMVLLLAHPQHHQEIFRDDLGLTLLVRSYT